MRASRRGRSSAESVDRGGGGRRHVAAARGLPRRRRYRCPAAAAAAIGVSRTGGWAPPVSRGVAAGSAVARLRAPPAEGLRNARRGVCAAVGSALRREECRQRVGTSGSSALLSAAVAAPECWVRFSVSSMRDTQGHGNDKGPRAPRAGAVQPGGGVGERFTNGQK